MTKQEVERLQIVINNFLRHIKSDLIMIIGFVEETRKFVFVIYPRKDGEQPSEHIQSFEENEPIENMILKVKQVLKEQL